MRTLFYGAFITALSACTPGHKKPDVQLEQTLQQQVKLEKQEEKKEEPSEVPAPLDLQPAQLKFRELQWSENATSDSVLLTLFPGTAGSLEEKIYTLWRCPDCEVKSYPAWLENQPEFFPDNQGMETNVAAVYDYTEKGHTYRTIFFSSHEIRYGDLGGGRFNAAMLGAARLEHIAARWKLDAFTPAVGCTGKFDDVAVPDSVRLPDGTLHFILLDQNGGPDGPVFGNYYLYGFTGHSLQCEFSLPDGFCTFGENEWSTEINFRKTGNGRPGLIANTIGKYTASTEEEMRPYDMGQPWENIFSQKEYNHYLIIQTYTFHGGIYHMQNRRIDLSHK